jgi:hypothetical protein
MYIYIYVYIYIQYICIGHIYSNFILGCLPNLAGTFVEVVPLLRHRGVLWSWYLRDIETTWTRSLLQIEGGIH